MKIKLFFPIVLLIIIGGCNKDDSPTPIGATTTPLTPTSLEITVVDDSGNAIQGALVKLYGSSYDLHNHSNQIGDTKTSDANGKVYFSNLLTKQYFWYAQKDGKSNKYERNYTDDTLVAHKKNTAFTTLSCKGEIIIAHSHFDDSDGSFRISILIDGISYVSSNVNIGPLEFIMPAGAHSIHVSAYKDGACSWYHSDKTYNINLLSDSVVTINP